MIVVDELRALDKSQRAAFAAGLLGWTLDAFDFFLLTFILEDVAKEFGAKVSTVSVAITLTLMMRPLGAFVFGRLADRFGRRPVLMADVLLYSVLAAASAFAPNLASLLAIRAAFGFAMGGEWGIGSSLALESIPAKSRGVVSGILQEGYALGFLLASLVNLLLPVIHWRGMLLVSILPALLVLYIRRHVKESPAWEATRAERRAGAPVHEAEPLQVIGRAAPTVVYALFGIGALLLLLTNLALGWAGDVKLGTVVLPAGPVWACGVLTLAVAAAYSARSGFSEGERRCSEDQVIGFWLFGGGTALWLYLDVIVSDKLRGVGVPMDLVDKAVFGVLGLLLLQRAAKAIAGLRAGRAPLAPRPGSLNAELGRRSGLLIYVVVLMTAFNLFSHGTQDLYPTFLKVQHRFAPSTVTILTVIANCGAILGGVLFGALSERIGRRRAIALAAVLALPVLPLWAFGATPVVLAVGAFLIQVSVQGAWGVVPVHLNELSPADARGTFPGFAYQLGNFIASGNAVVQARIAESRHDNYGVALAVVAGSVAVVLGLLTLFGPEAKGVSFARPEPVSA